MTLYLCKRTTYHMEWVQYVRFKCRLYITSLQTSATHSEPQLCILSLGELVAKPGPCSVFFFHKFIVTHVQSESCIEWYTHSVGRHRVALYNTWWDKNVITDRLHWSLVWYSVCSTCKRVFQPPLAPPPGSSSWRGCGREEEENGQDVRLCFVGGDTLIES